MEHVVNIHSALVAPRAWLEAVERQVLDMRARCAARGEAPQLFGDALRKVEESRAFFDRMEGR